MDGSRDQAHDDIRLESLLTIKASSGESDKRGSENREGFRTPLNKERVWARHLTAIQKRANHPTSQISFMPTGTQTPLFQPDGIPETTIG
jgi:hypothetical protein